MIDMKRGESTNERASSDKTIGPAKCPICGEPLRPDRPSEAGTFCSKRCRQIDLGRWLGGDYMISRPIEQADLDEE